MSTVTLNQFGSSAPRLADHLLSVKQSSEALDCKLWHGTLASWRELRFVRDAPAGTVVRHGCCWLDFPGGCVDTAYGPATCNRLFVTGWKDYPVEAVFDGDDACLPRAVRLGIPCPSQAPSATDMTGGDPTKDVEARSYAYQYVKSTGEAGALSPPTDPELINDGNSVVVSGWPVPAPEWDIATVRIYRSVAGHQSGREAANVMDTTWMLVDEVPIATTSVTDAKYNDALDRALEEDVVSPPPAGLQGIVSIEGTNILAGFLGRRVYFSENNQYHNWPYFLTLDEDVRGICESNGVVYAATNGRPYAIVGISDCEHGGCRQATRLPGHFPLMGRGNPHMASVSQGAAYPSTDGLVLLTGAAAPHLITWARYAPDNWQSIRPETVVIAQHRGQVFVFAQEGAFCMKLEQGPEGGWGMDAHTELSDRGVTQAFTGSGGGFYLVKSGKVYEWDRGDELRPHKYTSPEIVSPTPINFGAANVFHQNGEESVRIECDGHEVVDVPILTSGVFRLPNWALGTRWKVTFEGKSEVSLFSMATTMRQLGA